MLRNDECLNKARSLFSVTPCSLALRFGRLVTYMYVKIFTERFLNKHSYGNHGNESILRKFSKKNKVFRCFAYRKTLFLRDIKKWSVKI